MRRLSIALTSGRGSGTLGALHPAGPFPRVPPAKPREVPAMRIVWKECVAELIGTFALCFIGAGAICTDALTKGQVGLIGIAMAHGLVLSIAVSSTMAISGGQPNPAGPPPRSATGRLKQWEPGAHLNGPPPLAVRLA